MNKNKIFGLLLLVAFTTFWVSGAAQADAGTPEVPAQIQVVGQQVEWVPLVENDGARLTVVGPDGQSFMAAYAKGEKIIFSAAGADGKPRLAGDYRYELIFTPLLDAALRARIEAARAAGQDLSALEIPAIAPLAGGFSLQGGVFALPSAEVSGDSQDPGLIAPADAVTEDDAIIRGSLCVGLDCLADGTENFGFDTLRFKENNIRLHFDDTSATAGFPATDWGIELNDAASGGSNYFAILERTTSTTPFKIMGAAPTNSMFISAQGKLGIGTSTPVLLIHEQSSDTPAIRLDQTGAGGFTPQVWDVAGNEANFFVRDLTNGSTYPFRIRPGAPTSSIDIASTGNVGIGTSSPLAKLHVAGNVRVDGYISERSDVNAKENFAAVDGAEVLTALRNLPMTTWSYKDDPLGVRHMGLMAQDFYQAFGLGADELHIAALDVNGVSLAAIQELARQGKEKDAQISALQTQVNALEARLRALESVGANWQPFAFGLAGMLAGGWWVKRKDSTKK